MSELHDHSHVEAHGGGTKAETVALLEYMAHHNEHHAEELLETAVALPEAAAEKLREAAAGMRAAAGTIRAAIDLLEG